jgi:dTDP-4-dehydrorhamnose reductase
LKSLVLGAGGQLGSELARLTGEEGTGFSREDLSVADVAGLHQALSKHRPEVVFNCAAYNAVDRAEAEPALANEVNAVGPGNVAAACRRLGVRLVHFSTNFVFDGLLERPYVESDTPRPLGAYGRSKLAGERAVVAADPSALVIRTAAVFGDRGSAIKGGSFPERIVERALRREAIKVVSDQTVNPTYARDLAQAALQLGAGKLSGVVHMVAGGCCGWDELARAALAECGIDADVEGISSDELAAAARRPLNGCLESTRTAALRPWREAVAEWAARRPAGREDP